MLDCRFRDQNSVMSKKRFSFHKARRSRFSPALASARSSLILSIFLFGRGPGLAITPHTHAVCFQLLYLRPFFDCSVFKNQNDLSNKSYIAK